MTWLPWIGLVLCLLAVAFFGLSIHGAKRWTAITWALTSRLEAARTDAQTQWPSPARYESRDIEGLPVPVQRYFRAVLKESQPIIAAFTLEIAGTFNLSSLGRPLVQLPGA